MRRSSIANLVKGCGKQKVLSLELEELRVGLNFKFFVGLFQICGSQKVKSASPCLV